MKIDTEKHQEFLSLLYSLQNNKSNAAISPSAKANEIEDRKVYRAYDWDKQKYMYSLEPISDHQKRQESEKFKKPTGGGRPPVLKQQDKDRITQWGTDGVSNREIARRLKVSEGVIRKYLKSLK